MEKIISVPAIEETAALVTHCIALKSIGVIAGPPGCGKTVSLKNAAEHASRLGCSGSAHYFRVFVAEGPARGVKDLIDDLGTRGGMVPKGASLQTVGRIAQREFRNRNVRLLLIDGADDWGPDALRGFINVIDSLRDGPDAVTAILAGNEMLPKMVSQQSPLLSRTLRVTNVGPLTPAWMLGVLRKWNPAFDRLAEAMANDRASKMLAKRIHQGTGGFLRRMSFFATLYASEFNDQEVTEDRIDHCFALMLRGDKSC